jgi:hypothetical protein
VNIVTDALICRIECVVGAHIYALDCMLTAVLIHDPGVNELPHIHRRVGWGGPCCAILRSPTGKGGLVQGLGVEA